MEAAAMQLFPEAFNVSTNHADSQGFTIKQKLIVRNMDFKNNRCTEAREMNKKELHTGSGAKRRLHCREK
eukprot:4670482-Prymnesium_polylepis.1